MPQQGDPARRLASNLLTKAAHRTPLKWLRACSGTSLVVPYYHVVSDGPVPHVSHLYRFRTLAEFKSDVDFFLQDFEPVSLSDIVDALNGKRTFRRPSFHLTFDDGFREMHEVVGPVLQRAGVPATFFLNTAFLDGGGLAHHNALSLLVDKLQSREAPLTAAALRHLKSLLPPASGEPPALAASILSIPYARRAMLPPLAEALQVDLDAYVRDRPPYLTSQEIAALLAAGFTIGAHSHDHPYYADLPLSQQLSQTQLSLQTLDARYGLKWKAFAFPHSDYGVEDSFFNSVFSEPLLDVTFGTAGLVAHRHPRNIERVRMEGSAASASRIMARQFARAACLRVRPR